MIVDQKYYRRRMRLNSISTVAHSDGLHFRNMLNVILELCRFEPFAREMLTPNSAVSRFVAKRVANLNSWSENLDDAERLGILAGIEATPVERALLASGVLPLLHRLARQRKTGLRDRIRSALEYLMKSATNVRTER